MSLPLDTGVTEAAWDAVKGAVGEPPTENVIAVEPLPSTEGLAIGVGLPRPLPLDTGLQVAA